MIALKVMSRAAALAALGLAHTLAMAQVPPPVVVTFGVDAASVPTLSQWGMIIMSALLAVAAVIAMRKNSSSKTVLSLALAALVSFGAFNGSELLAPARANGYTTYNLSSGTGGQLSLPSSSAFVYVLNDIPTTQRILGISPLYSDQREEGGNPPCYVGIVLAQNQACALRTRPPV
ncbi:MAG: midcut-by-XrtH protein [Hydrogenophaga sp.]|nr:midcut-by-XrtH protein [Hydrogenophaga sp.]